MMNFKAALLALLLLPSVALSQDKIYFLVSWFQVDEVSEVSHSIYRYTFESPEACADMGAKSNAYYDEHGVIYSDFECIETITPVVDPHANIG